MGLGKTLQALAVACAYREDWPILVVAPSSLRANWRDEATKWVPGLTKENIQVHEREDSIPAGVELDRVSEALFI